MKHRRKPAPAARINGTAAPSRFRIDVEALPPTQRSSVTNGRKMLIEQDGNSPWFRRYRDLVAGHCSDLGGAHAAISEAQMSLIKRVSAIECELERMEGKLSQGEPVDLILHQRLTNTLRRALMALGLERRAKPIE